MVWLYHTLFIYSSINEYLDCFQIIAIINNTEEIGLTCLQYTFW